MGNFFDQAARVLASPMPRRKALRTLGGAAATGILAALGVASASARSAPAVCTPTCKPNETCCPGLTKAPFCRTVAKTCCGDTTCKADTEFCCGVSDGATKPFCRTAKKTCCGNTTCTQGQACVNGRCQASKK